MAYPSLTFANLLNNATRQELEQLISLLQGYLSVEHDETGAHTDITADSITVEGDGTFGGDVTAQSADTITKCRMGEIQDLLTGTGVTSGLHLGGTKGWVVGLRLAGSPGTATDYELRLFDLNHLVAGVSALRLFYYTANSFWTLGVETGGALALGEDAAGKRLSEVNTILARSSAGYYERGRTPAVGEWTAYTPTWTSGGTGFTVGDGTLTGEYAIVGKTCFYHLVAIYGTTTVDPNPGNAWLFGLPFTAALAFSDKVMGTAHVEDSGVAAYAGWMATINTSTSVSVSSPGTAAAASSTLTNANPFAFGAGDFVVVKGFYALA